MKAVTYQKNGKIQWIDFAKFAAILAVIMDHMNGTLYTDQSIAIATYFSVSLFILLSGITSYISDMNHREDWKENVYRCTHKILLSYAVATLIYMIVNNKAFDISEYLFDLIHFNVAGPFYFVLLYCQLMLINKVLFQYLRYTNKFSRTIYLDFILGIAILFFSILTTGHTNILEVYGGGGKLLGGTYLFLYYLGMIIAKYNIGKVITNDASIKRQIFLLCITILLAYHWWKYECSDFLALDEKLPFGYGMNPPSVSNGVLAIIVLYLCYSLYSVSSRIRFLQYITQILCYIGTNSMYIFLYHILVAKKILIPYIKTNYIADFIIFILGMIIMPLLIHFILDRIRRIFVNMMKIDG